MINKNKIYAAVSITVIILTAASFFAAVSFLLKINNLVFSVDDNMVKEQTTVLNKESFEKIKNKLNPEKNNINSRDIPANIDSADSGVYVSPSPASSSMPIVSPIPKVILSPTPTPRE